MFDDKSRYKNLQPYEVRDTKGRKVTVVPVPPAAEQEPLGRHLMQQGQRIDHLSRKYLEDPAGYWRICEMNDVMLPDDLAQASEIVIPVKNRNK
ncbi:MAG: hypothetical protein WCJ26_11740 [bacterium]